MQGFVLLMFIPIFLRTEMPLRFHRLTTLWADGASARGNLHAPARQHPHLRARRPKADHRGRLGIILFGQQFLCEDDDTVAILVITQPDLSDTE
jgi:hypothetical protein